MIGTPKSFASLSSGLLARKGQAKPAMRPQSFAAMVPGAQDDLGWNDMGDGAAPHAPREPQEAAPKPVVLRQIEALPAKLAAPEPTPPAPPASAPAGKSLSPAAVRRVAREAAARKTRAAFTLRLDAERHLRLRLASAVANRSAQQLVTEALDRFLEGYDDVEALARQIDVAADKR